MYAIVSGSEEHPLYLTGITKGRCATWESDGIGRIVRKVERKPVKETGAEKGLQIVGHYMPDVSKARMFRSIEAAQKLISEYKVLRFCRVKEVSG